MKTAITRGVSDGITRCELTHLDRDPIDLGRAREQHGEYESALERLGYRLHQIPADPDLPDCVFVEDTALVLDEVAVLTRPGATSRRGELFAVADVLQGYRPLLHLEGPGTLDGGDVLRVGRTLFVGRTPRTSDEGIARLRLLLAPFDYSVEAVEVQGCLHLKTGVTLVAPGLLLLNREWIDTAPFSSMRLLDVDPLEPMGANTLRVGEALIYPEAYPRTRARLEREGLRVHPVPADELAKAEGGVTCCSLLVEG